MQRVNDTESKEGSYKAADQLGFIKGLNILFVTFFTFLGVIVLGFCIVNYLGYEELRDKHDALASQASVNFVFNQGQEEILFRNNERLFNLQNYVDELVARRINEVLSNQTDFVNTVNQVVAENQQNLGLALNAQGIKIRADAAAEINSNVQDFTVHLDQAIKSAAADNINQIKTLAPPLMRQELNNFRQTDINSLNNPQVFSFKNSAQNNGALNVNIDSTSVQLQTTKSSGPTPLIVMAERFGVNIISPQYSIHTAGTVYAEEDVCTKAGKCLNAIDTNLAFLKNSDGSVQSQDSLNVLRINALSNVVISGTSTDVPTERLHVFGKIKADDVCTTSICLNAIAAQAMGIGFIKDPSTGAVVSADTSNTVLITGGKVAIGFGATLPTEVLHVNGNVKATKLCVGVTCLDEANLKNSFTYTDTLITSRIGSFYIKSDGSVGLGTSTPAEKLQVSGNVLSNSFCMTGHDDGSLCLAVNANSITLSPPNVSASNDSRFKISSKKSATDPASNVRNALLNVNEIQALSDNTYTPGNACKNVAGAPGLSWYQKRPIFCDQIEDKWKFVVGTV